MKSHISVTIDKELVSALDQISRREGRPLNNVLEDAVAAYVKQSSRKHIVASAGIFDGIFSRKRTCANFKH